jgi:hypothetical protein
VCVCVCVCVRVYLLHFSCPVSKTKRTVHHVGKNERVLS